MTRLSDSAGASVGHYQYLPYGGLLSSSAPLSGNPLTFTAREDDGTGLMYYRARYYDPSLQVFISQDPLGDDQRYVGGNPVGLDPIGLWGGQPAIYDLSTQGRPHWQNSTYDSAPDLTATEFAPFLVPEFKLFSSAIFICKIAEGLESKGAPTWTFGTFKSAEKWANQMKQRGWTAEQIKEAIFKGKSYCAPNKLNPGNTATRYVHPKTG